MVESGLKKQVVEKVFSKLITTGWGLWKAALFVSGAVSIKGLIQARSAHLKPRWAGWRTTLNTGLKDALVAVCCFSSKWWNNIWSSRINTMRGNGPEGRKGVMRLGPVNGALVCHVYSEGKCPLTFREVICIWTFTLLTSIVAQTQHTKWVRWSGNDIMSILSWSWQTGRLLRLHIACESPRSGLWAAPYVMETRLMIQNNKNKEQEKSWMSLKDACVSMLGSRLFMLLFHSGGNRKYVKTLHILIFPLNVAHLEAALYLILWKAICVWGGRTWVPIMLSETKAAAVEN